MSFDFRGTVNLVLDPAYADSEEMFDAIQDVAHLHIDRDDSYSSDDVFNGYLSIVIDTRMSGEDPVSSMMDAFSTIRGVAGVFVVDDESHRGELSFTFTRSLSDAVAMQIKTVYINDIIKSLLDVSSSFIGDDEDEAQTPNSLKGEIFYPKPIDLVNEKLFYGKFYYEGNTPDGVLRTYPLALNDQGQLDLNIVSVSKSVDTERQLDASVDKLTALVARTLVLEYDGHVRAYVMNAAFVAAQDDPTRLELDFSKTFDARPEFMGEPPAPAFTLHVYGHVDTKTGMLRISNAGDGNPGSNPARIVGLFFEGTSVPFQRLN